MRMKLLLGMVLDYLFLLINTHCPNILADVLINASDNALFY